MQKMEKKIKLLPPTMPNYIAIEGAQGITTNAAIPVKKTYSHRSRRIWRIHETNIH